VAGLIASNHALDEEILIGRKVIERNDVNRAFQFLTDDATAAL
jgi:hypothetical protein